MRSSVKYGFSEGNAPLLWNFLLFLSQCKVVETTYATTGGASCLLRLAPKMINWYARHSNQLHGLHPAQVSLRVP